MVLRKLKKKFSSSKNAIDMNLYQRDCLPRKVCCKSDRQSALVIISKLHCTFTRLQWLLSEPFKRFYGIVQHIYTCGLMVTDNTAVFTLANTSGFYTAFSKWHALKNDCAII